MLYHFPLADCHVHANGMATKADVRRLADKGGVKLPVPHINEDGSRYWDKDDPASFHEAYDATVRLMRAPEDIKDVVKAALRRMAGEGCIYAGILASGSNNCRNGDLVAVYAKNTLALVSAIREAHAETGIQAFVSLTAKRHLQDGPARAHQLLDAHAAFQEKYPAEAYFVPGFNMAGSETEGRCADFDSVFKRAHEDLGLDCGCHASEELDAHDGGEAISLPGMKRGAHLLAAARDPALRRVLREKNILIEQMLTMNEALHHKTLLSPQDHPIRNYYEEGLSLGLGSDDPGILDCSIGTEYRKARDKYHFGPEALLSFTVNSIRLGVAPAVVKAQLMGEVRDFAARHGLLMRPGAATNVESVFAPNY